MYKVLFRVGNEKSYIWKEVVGTFLKEHANTISQNLMHRHVFNVIIPVEEFKGLPETFELSSAQA